MEISIKRDYANNKAYIYLLGGSHNDAIRENFSYNSEDQSIVINFILEGDGSWMSLKPFLVLPLKMADELIKAFTDLCSEMNVKTENESLF